MPKATRAKDSTTPKKRTRKAAAAEVVAQPGNGAPVAETAGATPELARNTVLSKELEQKTVSHNGEARTAPFTGLEEKIRIRAYELFLQRGGRSGSPEQDWLQAEQEIRSELIA